ncbi:MAG TPA: NAD(P)-binding domain-containing protein [Kutzneria sp.]|nr:NAD(P)-binding domain-containing protein [Kutzneria sp.]
MTLALIGTGMIGSTVARLAVDAGIDVVLSNSRGPETLADLVAELGPRARAATAAEAAAAGDIVVVTIPLHAYTKLPVAELAGKTVIDTLNYYPQRDGNIPELDSGELTTSGLLQRHLVGAHVVKGFNNIYFKALATLGRPAGAPDRSALPIAGDDAAAKAAVVELLDRLGYDAVDIGGLADSWRSENGKPAYAMAYVPEAPAGLSQEDAMRWFTESAPVPASAERIRELLAKA